MPAVQDLHRKYEERAAFFVVYIREAHASDAWQVSSNVRDGVVHTTPVDLAERCELAGACAASLELEFPALVDGFDDATDTAYTGWPDRLYVIGRDGRIAYKSGPGPFGFEPSEVGDVLARLLP